MDISPIVCAYVCSNVCVFGLCVCLSVYTMLLCVHCGECSLLFFFPPCAAPHPISMAFIYLFIYIYTLYMYVRLLYYICEAQMFACCFCGCCSGSFEKSIFCWKNFYDNVLFMHYSDVHPLLRGWASDTCLLTKRWLFLFLISSASHVIRKNKMHSVVCYILSGYRLSHTELMAFIVFLSYFTTTYYICISIRIRAWSSFDLK